MLLCMTPLGSTITTILYNHIINYIKMCIVSCQVALPTATESDLLKKYNDNDVILQSILYYNVILQIIFPKNFNVVNVYCVVMIYYRSFILCLLYHNIYSIHEGISWCLTRTSSPGCTSSCLDEYYIILYYIIFKASFIQLE